jgi:two-component system, response regulator PdtaR
MIKTLRQIAAFAQSSLAPSPPPAVNLNGFTAIPRLKVLLVEDDEPDAYLIGQVLEENPRVREVMLAEDGVKALELVRCGWFNPDLAIVDIKLPRKDGFSLLEDFSNIAGPRFPSLILSSSKARSDAWQAMHYGAIEFISKSPSRKQLAAELDRAIEAAF